MGALTKQDVRKIVREEIRGLEQRLDGHDQRFETIDQRLNKIDQRFEQVDQRFDKMDQRIGNLEERLHRSEILFEEREKVTDTILEIVLANQKTLETLAPLVNCTDRCELAIEVLNLAFRSHVTDQTVHRG